MIKLKSSNHHRSVKLYIMKKRHYSRIDRLIQAFDNSLRTLTLIPQSSRPNPAGNTVMAAELNETEKKHIAGLMRINHTGEICAQALYQAQALTAKNPAIQQTMRHASIEENDHLNWCASRLQALESHTSYLTPLCYSASFSIGTMAGLAGDRWNLGFVAETEDQVTHHLEQHLRQIPEKDTKTRAILSQMVTDEKQHAEQARNQGGKKLPWPIRFGMKLTAKVMTTTAYRI
ncbi:2-nonaprenyl-3-methyl-6-methoxy-1,4-benzoquinol hydroxylase [Piscirickettsia salmonis]|uniref:3-demethoxyubiquinol 3-hydroxylase n=2 Tax=Piscirickettsia salmonis TaxID=1238 RepID=A0AAC8VJF8_PISSA|nr:2-nonaprenyl-3-methyl-6-methoxy-1,4-benzoquinol hydroxylase [Piscirickettsia salmonis]QGN97803.1 2-nonaprenyl-3-methyl-6-methoxy-1,4-benzoquinol hydroxylase [Piscirickettsia salmonis]QGO01403.1 2-nonaprenyl-3-methyl-6-methoxy-1,4-benzoquinol hydroxylase [Piscirickettsia salmonis]QGO12120.1 2-nonaprenyl-3-methyl-6-methoxy-1,4-benzoquinol hydroxylase [Piscirickettsia salmonis]QGO19140.1 2-nonaprenyl-3-methyl-6-methoxy-1,4-benzoquinol hydroxylase [Piscirickettsia salmonis]